MDPSIHYAAAARAFRYETWQSDRRYIREFNCSEVHDLSNTSCKAFQPLFNTLVTLHLTAVNRVHAVINQMYHILPDSYHIRHSIGLFDLGDEFWTPSFVWPPPNNLMLSVLLHVICNNAHAFHSWQKHAEAMSSFMSVANERMDNLAHVIRQ